MKHWYLTCALIIGLTACAEQAPRAPEAGGEAAPETTEARHARGVVGERLVRALPGGLALATSPTSGLSARFDAAGVRLEGPGGERAWSARVELARFGRDGAMRAASAATPTVDGERVSFAREGVTEWFVNADGGLEHGFTVPERPAGRGALRFEVDLEGAQASQLGDDALALRSGGRTVRYEKLAVWDARGEALSASMRPRPGGFEVVVDDAGAAYPVTVDPVFTQEAKLTASDAAADDGFGGAVSISGARALVGADGEDNGGADSGAAYVFEQDANGSWIEVAKLTASDAAAGDAFGRSVSLQGDTAFVGASASDANGLDSGAVYVFTRDAAGAWSQDTKLTAGVAGDAFGYAVALSASGARAVIGAYNDDISGDADAGSAYVFERDAAGVWSQTAKLTASDSAADDYFGGAVAVDGDLVLIGAYRDTDRGSGSGSAYLYELYPTFGWVEADKITGVGVGNVDLFGISVALRGDTALIGAEGDDLLGGSAGAAYIFERSGQFSWALDTLLYGSDGGLAHRFGHSVAMSEDRLVVGAPGRAAWGGAAYIFERHAGDWVEREILVGGDTAGGDRLGHAVSISGDRALAGAVRDDDAGTSSGSAYVFETDFGANDDSATVDEDTSIEINVLANDVTSINPSLASAPTTSAGGATTVTPQRTIEYTPAPDFNGVDTFDYFISNGGVTRSATVTVTVNPVNDVPVAQVSAEVVIEDTPLAFTLDFTDAESSEPGAAYTFAFPSPPAHGALSGAGPSLTYTPDPGFNGADSFTFTVTDVDGETSNAAQVSLTVTRAVQAAKLTATDGAGSDRFAQAVSLDGDRALIGAYQGDVTAGPFPREDAGAAYVFERDASGSWSEVAKLIASDAARDDEFGTRVALSDDLAVIGSPRDDNGGNSSGSAYVFERDASGAWVEVAKLTASDAGANDWFGSNVAISGEALVVGSPFDDDGGDSSGSAYVFERDAGGSWVEVAKLTASDAGSGDNFGEAVSIDGEVVVVGASDHGARGAAYVFERDGSGAWPQVAKLVASDSASGDNFGISVASSGPRVLAGASGDDDAGPSSGSAYVFERDAAGVWSQVAKLTADDAAAGDLLGFATSLEGDVALVGASGDDDAGPSSGSAYVFERDAAGVWSQVIKLVADDAAADDRFGIAASVSDDRALIGASRDDDVGADSGSAYVFELNLSPLKAFADGVTVDEDTSIEIDVLANDVTQGSATIVSASNTSAAGTVTITPRGTIEYTPAPNFNGTETFEYSTSEGGLESSSVVTVTVNPVNDVPVAQVSAEVVIEDTPLAFTLDFTDAESSEPGAAYTFAFPSPPAHGALSGAGPSLTYTPDPDYFGADSFTFTVTDVDGETSAAATVSLDVTSRPDAPVAFAQDVTLDEDTPRVITLAGADVDGTALAFSITTQPAHGTLSGVAPSLTYTPDPDFSGVDSFDFTISSGGQTSNAARVDLTITEQPDLPVAQSQSVSLDEDTLVAIVLTGSDADGTPVAFDAPATTAQGGTLTGVAPNLTYTPPADFNGADSFDFTVASGGETSAPATVSIQVDPVNDAPVADPDAVVVAEDASVAITLTGSDLESAALTFAVTTAPANGSLAGAAPNLTYTPDPDYSGPDLIEFTVEDADGATSAAARVDITVTPGPDAPVAQPKVVTLDEDTTAAIVLAGADADGTPVAFGAPSTTAQGGALTGTAPNLTYTPPADFDGADSFEFVVTSGGETSAPATVSIQVDPVNDAPVAQDQTVVVSEDTPAGFTLVGTDADGDTLTFTVTQAPSSGALSGTAPNLTYTPDPNFTGTDTLTFQADDGALDSNVATITFDVGGANDAPVAQAQAVEGDEDTPITITLTGADPEGQPLTYRVTGQPANGTLTGTAPELTYTPDADFNGADALRFVVDDGALDSPEAIVSITLRPVNDAPVARDVQVATREGTAARITLEASDVDSGALTYSTSQPLDGALSGTPPEVVYTPEDGFSGTDTFRFTASDGELTSRSATVTVTVTSGPNAPPEFVAPTPEDGAAFALEVGQEVSFELAAVDPDAGPMELTLELTGAPEGAAFDEATGVFAWTPDLDEVGAVVDAGGRVELLARASDGLAVTERAIVLTAALADSDGDGVLDARDNCPADANADQIDADADGVGDACEVPVFIDVDQPDDSGCGCASVPSTPTPHPALVLAILGALSGTRRRTSSRSARGSRRAERL